MTRCLRKQAPDRYPEAKELIGDLKTVIVQGRYDVICPPRTAFVLAQAIQNADLQMINDAGHAALEPGIRSALVGAANEFVG